MPNQQKNNLALFAADTTIFTQDADLHTATNQLQMTINTLSKWYNEWCISLNPTKCATKVFTLKYIKEYRSIYINGNIIP